MASTNTLQVLQNGSRNAVIRATQVSDGTDGESVTVYNATSSGPFGVRVAGQMFYPGIYTRLVKITFSVQDMKIAARWDADTDQDILVLAETFNFTEFGGIPVPSGLTGATGSINIVSLGPLVGAAYSVLLHLHKGVPQS